MRIFEIQEILTLIKENKIQFSSANDKFKTQQMFKNMTVVKHDSSRNK